MQREARGLIWGENFCFPPDWQKGRVVQNDTGGENTEKEGSNLRAARTQWAKVEGPPERKDEDADRLSVALRRGRRRGGVGGSRRQGREAISGSLAALCRE